MIFFFGRPGGLGRVKNDRVVFFFALGVLFTPCENNGITLTPQFLERLVVREI